MWRSASHWSPKPSLFFFYEVPNKIKVWQDILMRGSKVSQWEKIFLFLLSWASIKAPLQPCQGWGVGWGCHLSEFKNIPCWSFNYPTLCRLTSLSEFSWERMSCQDFILRASPLGVSQTNKSCANEFHWLINTQLSIINKSFIIQLLIIYNVFE